MGLWLKVGKKFNVGDEQVLMAFVILVKVPHRKQVCLVNWQKLEKGWFKLNCGWELFG